MKLLRNTNIFLKALTVCVLSGVSSGVSAKLDALVFPEIKGNHNEGDSFSEKNIIPTINFFASGEAGSVLVLIEAFASESVQHVERLQLGVDINDSSRAWFGRHHNPFGYWHTQYHHGTYLQTSVSRPALVELGGAGGIMPTHTSGGLLEAEIEHEQSAWQFSLSVGLTSQLDSSGGGHHGGSAAASLHDFDIFNPKPDDHKVGTTLRAAYLPDALGESQFGAFALHAKITTTPVESEHDEMSDGGDITLDVAGVFANYHLKNLRIVSEWFYFSSKVPRHDGSRKGSFSAAYIQLEQAVNERWTPYFRFEDTFKGDKDSYLELLNRYSRRAQAVGVRFDIIKNNAIKLEYTHKKFDHDSTGLWLLSWSAVWP